MSDTICEEGKRKIIKSERKKKLLGNSFWQLKWFWAIFHFYRYSFKEIDIQDGLKLLLLLFTSLIYLMLLLPYFDIDEKKFLWANVKKNFRLNHSCVVFLLCLDWKMIIEMLLRLMDFLMVAEHFFSFSTLAMLDIFNSDLLQLFRLIRSVIVCMSKSEIN